jgi:4-hydroxyphenylpyruvate dioxygenase
MPNTSGLRTAIATVCLSGILEEKLPAAAAAGFDGVEIFEPDLISAPWSPAEVRHRCADLGLTVDLYQPFRDFEATPPEVHAQNLRRAELKFDLMEQLGADTVLFCSSVSPDAIDDDDLAAEQLHAVAARAAERGMRIAYEALAWGRHVSTWDHSWEIVRKGDHPALGLCLDSFHVLSRGSDTAGISDLPGDRIFFLQLADAPAMEMGVLQWSRHHRLFPGQGSFDLTDFVGRVLSTGYEGPLSLEVFNDVFRQSDPRRTAVDALRSLLALQEDLARDGRFITPQQRARLVQPAVVPPTRGMPFVEVGVDARSGEQLAEVLAALGFTQVGQHRSKPVQLWEQAWARVLLNWGVPGPARVPGPAGTEGSETGSASGQFGHAQIHTEPGTAGISAFAVQTPDVAGSVARAEALLAAVLPRHKAPAEADLPAVAAPDGTSIFFCESPDDDGPASWLGDFLPTGVPAESIGAAGLTHIDHVALTQPFDSFDEAALFYRSVLGLRAQTLFEFSAPVGLQRSRAMKNPDGTVRIPLSVGVLRSARTAGLRDPQHVAFACRDIFTAAAALRKRGAPLLAVPDNYYDDLDARWAPEPDLLRALREFGILYDRDSDGEFFQFYTEVLGSRLFFEVVQRVDGYDGYGAINTPVHLAAHHRERTRRLSPR